MLKIRLFIFDFNDTMECTNGNGKQSTKYSELDCSAERIEQTHTHAVCVIHLIDDLFLNEFLFRIFDLQIVADLIGNLDHLI